MKCLLIFFLCAAAFRTAGQTYQERAVAAVLMGEAWSEGVRGMTAVADVIRRRTLEKGWTPLAVVSAHRGRVHAFSCLNGVTIDQLIRKFSRITDYQTALQLAETLCQNPTKLPGIVGFADHYTRATEHPYWARGARPVALIGRHAFYKLDED